MAQGTRSGVCGLCEGGRLAGGACVERPNVAEDPNLPGAKRVALGFNVVDSFLRKRGGEESCPAAETSASVRSWDRSSASARVAGVGCDGRRRTQDECTCGESCARRFFVVGRISVAGVCATMHLVQVHGGLTPYDAER